MATLPCPASPGYEERALERNGCADQIEAGANPNRRGPDPTTLHAAALGDAPSCEGEPAVLAADRWVGGMRCSTSGRGDDERALLMLYESWRNSLGSKVVAMTAAVDQLSLRSAARGSVTAVHSGRRSGVN